VSSEAFAWLDGLREFAADATRRPRAAAETSPAQRAAERAVLAAHLVTWLDGAMEPLLAERGPERHPPAIVLTTSAAGLAAAADVLGRDDPLTRERRPRFAAVTELDYRLWCHRHPDPDHRLHVNHWSWIKTRVPEQRWPAFARHRLGPGECYWLHRTGTVGAGNERRFCHLWKWNGVMAVLLEPFVAERVGGL